MWSRLISISRRTCVLLVSLNTVNVVQWFISKITLGGGAYMSSYCIWNTYQPHIQHLLITVCSTPHLQEGEVSVVFHHGDLKVAHHNLTASIHLLHQVVLDLWISCHAQTILGAGTNNHWKIKEQKVLFLLVMSVFYSSLPYSSVVGCVLNQSPVQCPADINNHKSYNHVCVIDVL